MKKIDCELLLVCSRDRVASHTYVYESLKCAYKQVEVMLYLECCDTETLLWSHFLKNLMSDSNLFLYFQHDQGIAEIRSNRHD